MNEDVADAVPLDARQQAPPSEKPQGFVQRLFGSLAFKVGAAVIVTEILVLTGIGIPLIASNDASIDRRAVDRILIPGTLLQERVLSYASVADRRIMTDLLGEELISGMVVGGNGNVFYSLDTGHLGKDVGALPGIDPAWFDPAVTERQLIETRGGDETFLISVTPLFTLDSKVPSLFAYIKTNTTKLTEEKAGWRRQTLVGGLVVVLTTSLIIFMSFQKLIFRRIVRSVAFVERVREGELETRVTSPGSDEFGTLERGMNEMVANLKRRQEQQTKAEKALRESEERFRDMAESASDWFWEMGPDLRFTYISERYFEITGFRPEDKIGATRTRYVDPTDREADAEKWAAHLADLEIHKPFKDFEYSHASNTGRVGHARISGTSIFDSDGEFLGYRGTGTDITQRKRAERKVRALNEELEQRVIERTAELAVANRAKGHFLANMSHEIRTPLNAILGFAQIMKRDPTLGPAASRNLETISRSGDHLLALINDVLEMSKIDAGKIVLSPAPFDLVGLLRDLEVMFKFSAAEKRLSLELVIDEGTPQFILTDEGKLRRALINLLGNAVKFTNEGGVFLRVSAHRTHDFRLIFEVRDTGSGIAKGELDELFVAFEQTASGLNARAGTGLGLAISREHARLMGGDLTVSSQLGEGSTFRLEIYAEDAAIAIKSADTRRVVGLAAGQPAYRILVADDGEINRNFLVELLLPIGFTIDEATNGEEAIAAFESGNPDLALIDVRMPVMDGMEATRRIKALPGGKDTPIIAVTAYAFKEEQDEIMKCGSDGVLIKPLREIDLFDTLRSHLGIEYRYEEIDPPADDRLTKWPRVEGDAIEKMPGKST